MAKQPVLSLAWIAGNQNRHVSHTWVVPPRLIHGLVMYLGLPGILALPGILLILPELSPPSYGKEDVLWHPDWKISLIIR
ncbi:hypothetical protein C1N62_21420 (plasmid) [Nissabacter sp. SGAir0207]|nr:hypothetical protein C1N62_21420 [Nissabacter sp. SGAir0207]